MKIKFPRQIFEKYSNIKFHENPCNERRVVPCRRADTNDESFRNFANAPENYIRKKKTAQFTYFSITINDAK